MIIDWLPTACRNRFEQLDYIAEDNPLAVINAPFVVVYRLDGTKRIEILRLLHSSQQWP